MASTCGNVYPVISSRRHPLIAQLRAAARGDEEAVLLDGPHLVAEALRTGTTLAAVVVDARVRSRDEIAALCEAATRAGVAVHEVSGPAADAISPARAPVGIVALATLALQPLAALLDTPEPLLVVLTGVQDPGNIGSIIRTAEAAGATGVIVTADGAHPFGWKALRGSMGSALRVPIHRSADIVATLQACRSRGLHVLVTSSHAGDPRPTDAVAPLAVVLGAEGQGVSARVAALADATISITLDAGVESLNVSVAAGVLLFELRRLRTGRAVVGTGFER